MSDTRYGPVAAEAVPTLGTCSLLGNLCTQTPYHTHTQQYALESGNIMGGQIIEGKTLNVQSQEPHFPLMLLQISTQLI